jgi:hypothetical protein
MTMPCQTIRPSLLPHLQENNVIDEPLQFPEGLDSFSKVLLAIIRRVINWVPSLVPTDF